MNEFISYVLRRAQCPNFCLDGIAPVVNYDAVNKTFSNEPCPFCADRATALEYLSTNAE